MSIELKIDVTYEVDDEVALRAAAMASTGDGNWNAGDAVMRLLMADALERLQLPGAKVTAVNVQRNTAIE